MVLKKRFLTVFTLGGCDGLERRDVLTVSSLGRCSGLGRSDF